MSFRPSVRPSVVRPSVVSFPNNSLSKCQLILPNFVCVLILWRSGLGLLMGKVRQFLTELYARDTSVFSFLVDNLSKSQRIFTKLGMCTDIMEMWFGQISLIFDRVICRHLIRTLI